MKISDISQSFKDLLSKHMQAYLGGAIKNVLDGEYKQNDKAANVYQLSLADETFLNTKGTVNAFIFKDGDKAIFCIAPKLEVKPFSGYFPQMVPKTPWLSEAESNLPFPNLPSRKVDNIQWWYVYSTETISDDLKKSFFGFDFGDAKKTDGFEAMLASLTRDDEKLDKKAQLQGLFYFGTLPSLPEQDMIPDFVKTAWGFVTDNIKIQGNVFRYKLLPYLRMQIPILNPPKDFRGDVVKQLEFSLALSSPLMAVPQLPELKKTETKPALLTDKKDEKKSLIKQSREVDLTGTLIFTGGKEVSLKGIWPLDEDTLVIAVTTELKSIASYIGRLDIPIDTGLKAGIAFKISKANKRLNAVEFKTTVQEWQVLPGILTFQNLDLTAGILHPGKVNAFNARLSATARLGTGDIKLLANGNYPNGTYNLYLDPATLVPLTDLIKIFNPDQNLGITGAGGVVISKLSGSYNPANKYFAFEMAVGQNAKLSADESAELDFTLRNLSLGIYGKGGKYSFKLDAKFDYKLNERQTLDFIGSASYNDGWQFSAGYKSISGDDKTEVSLYDIVERFKLGTPPDRLKDLSFKELAFAFDSKLGLKQFGGRFGLRLFKKDLDIELQLQKLKDATYFLGTFETRVDDDAEFFKEKVSFKVEFIKTTDGDKLELQMAFKIAGASIMLQTINDTTGSEGSVSEKQYVGGSKGLNLSLNNLLNTITRGVSLGDLPDGLLPELVLSDVYISYNGVNKEINLIALSTVNNHPIRFFIQYRSKTEMAPASYIFGVDSEVTGFENLPLVGGEMKDVSFTNVGFVYASAAPKYYLPQLVYNKDDKGAMPVLQLTKEAIAYNKGVTLQGNINLPNQDEPIALSLPVSKQDAAKLLLGADGIYALTTGDGKFQPAVKWLNINKKIGPLAVSKLGFGYNDGRLSLLISGSLILADLAVNAEGLGLSFSLSKLIKGENVEPKFELNGLGLALERQPLEISGMLLRAQPVGDEALSFYGAAQISTSGFSIKGIGAYAKMKDASDSLFIYGLYNGPIGGPAFFFVTGIAAGFGYNRTIRVPKLEEVKEFPLVAMALNPDNTSMATILDRLVTKQWIPTSAGDYWLALGIKFTSFNIIESFVLVTVKFGGKLEFAVVGLSLLKWPAKGNALVYIELAVLARFGPESDVIAVSAMLTPNSYVFHKDCKLTGGFAFYSWIAGPHEGDFVISLGGYHPQYKKPEHYPSVDRLALNWKFSDDLSLSGEMYFALTPKSLMAGGKWEVAYNKSFLSARVIIWADMYIEWAPFHYDIVAGVIVRIEANIKIAFIEIYFKLQMACVVHIWGPDFAGELYVDWTIFSFTIGFGSSSQAKPAKLMWSKATSNSDGFKEAFVPQKNGQDSLIDVRIVKGIMNQPVEKDKVAAENDNAAEINFVNTYDLILAVDSFFPLKTVETKVAGSSLPGSTAAVLKPLDDNSLMDVAGQDIPVTVGQRNKTFGVQPMGLTDIDTTLQVWLEKNGEAVTQNVAFIATAKGVSSALWGLGVDNEPTVMAQTLTGVQLHAVEALPDAKDTREVNLSKQFEPRPATAPLTLAKTHDFDPDYKKVPTIIQGILDSSRSGQTFDALKAMGFTELVKPDTLLFSSVLNDEMLYPISIGEKTPPKPTS